MIKVFAKSKEYETYAANGINSGEVCYVAEDKSAHFRTNNIDGTDKTYDMSEGSAASLTSLSVTENGVYDTTGTDYDGYDEVTVEVPASAVVSGSKSITENGSDIDVTEYAKVNVNVPIPAGYIVPTGAKSITENGTDIDVAQYATVNVSVSAPAPTWNTLSGNNLEMTVGTTYIFKTTSSNVAMSYISADTDYDDVITTEDDSVTLGVLTPNVEHYFTAVNDGISGNTAIMQFNQTGVQYAVLS
jgi:hypothetical protein